MVGTHHGANASADGVGEGPEVHFVHCAVVDVAADGVAEAPFVDLPEMLLLICWGGLVGDIVLVGRGGIPM